MVIKMRLSSAPNSFIADIGIFFDYAEQLAMFTGQTFLAERLSPASLSSYIAFDYFLPPLLPHTPRHCCFI